jgi:diguanylate cyclase (GGDEF)-like protein
VKPDRPLRARLSHVLDAGRRLLARLGTLPHRPAPGDAGCTRRTSLVARVLWTALVWAVGVYALTVAGLWITANHLIDENLQAQTSQRLVKLADLGLPLYLSDDPAYLLGLTAQFRNLPDVAYVRYLGPDGKTVLGEYQAEAFNDLVLAPLSPGVLDELATLDDLDRPQVLGDHPGEPGLFRGVTPLWIASLPQDGMLGFEFDGDNAERREVLGYLDVGIDSRPFREQLAGTTVFGSLVIALLFLVAALVARQVLKRSLAPLSDLSLPLKRLAQGDTSVRMESTGDEEIATICEAFNTTVEALRERDDRLVRMANFDALTGLVNRNYFTDQLEHELAYLDRQGGSSALFFIDLDRFKYVNDALGHAAGDRLLIKVTEVLHGRIREQDILARFGGDEFTLLARHVRRPEAERIAESIIKIMRDFRFVEAQQSFDINCSIGVTMIEAQPFGVDELLSQADIACHEAKAGGRNQYRVYEVSGQEKQQINLDIGLSRKIRDLLERDGFLVEYQPVVALDTGRVAMYEVLIRMTGEHEGLVPPNAFLPSADRFGLMDTIDRWVIAHATEQLRTLHFGERGLPFAVNIAGSSLENGDLAEYITAQLVAQGLPPSAIIFEINEEAALRMSEDAARRLRGLADSGVRFSLDAFGSGFSSFGWLKRLPVTYVKIDGDLVNEARRDPIMASTMRAIIEVAHTSGRKVIAMRVEDRETLEVVTRLGADYAQGFVLGRPARAPVAEAAIQLHAHTS